ncbi:MAG: Dolichyl-phosphate-mannose-protein mannosyltransferase [Acidobacteriota bacterium]|nr:Dolichyl-phosphate-mannose-protein mannosyltransferase [Acidobacteriota bacterium]
MSASAATVVTARISPEFFVGRDVRSASRTLIVSALALIILVGFGFRAHNLGAEGLSEDELNKLHAVEDYRAHGLTAANGEHPMLMKALLTASVVAAEHWNSTSIVASHPSLGMSTEAALRLPGVILGAFTSLLIFLVVSELFGIEVALIAAALWALDPSGISFNRIAKEDTFFLFFFLLANVFWLKGQRIAESGEGRPKLYYWATAIAFGAMLASKYLPHFMAISGSYYYIFQGIPATRWRMGKKKWLIFFAIMGVAFVIFNPTILLPGTWHEMRVFAGEQRIGHDSYEFMGTLYRNQMTLWLKGSPWYFYFVFMGVKISLPVILGFLIGLPLLFTKRLGDGRFFILFWLMYWFMPFTVMGGKFTRYFTMALPVVLITSAIGIHWVAHWVAQRLGNFARNDSAKAILRASLASLVLIFPLVASASVSPFYRLYTNALGGGEERAGSYFPHDEFYDARVREAVNEISAHARPGARVASETPALISYYGQLAGRNDLVALSLSDKEALKQFEAGDYVIVARGRRYFSNEAYVTRLEETSEPVATISLGSVPAIRLYVLDKLSLDAVSETLK